VLFRSVNYPACMGAVPCGGGSITSARHENGTRPPSDNTSSMSTQLYSYTENDLFDNQPKKPLKVLFLSADTGGGHRASAEALAKQFQLHYPGSTYDLLDIWSSDGIFPYKALVDSYKYLSSHPRQWRLFYHLSNTSPNLIFSNLHSAIMCERRIRRRIASYDPDVIVSVHPTMNRTPIIAAKKLSKAVGKHIPFFTVVTDLGSGHAMWFNKNIEKMYVASERIRKLARRRGFTPDEKIVMSGLPIRHDFAIQAQLMGDRTSAQGKEYQKKMREELGLDPEKQMVLVMGGGEGVGSLSDIVNELYAKFTDQGIDATICVVCGRNDKLKHDLEVRDWSKVLEARSRPLEKQEMKKTKRNEVIQKALDNAECDNVKTLGSVEVVGLGFVSKMAEFMVAADVLVTKAGPGTIAEAASVGLPVMLTSYLPGQEAGNVEVVLDAGFGDFNKKSNQIAFEVACWLKDPDLLKFMSHKTEEVGQPSAASDIVEDIGEITQIWMRLNGERKSTLSLTREKR